MALNYEYLTGVYSQIPVEDYFLLKRLGKVKEYSPIPKVKIRLEKGAMNLASLGQKGDPAKPIDTGVTVTEAAYDPPEIFEYYPITEDDVFNIVNPKIIAVQSTQDVISNLEYVAAKGVNELKQRAARRIEHMFAQIVTQGKINYNDGERSFQLDFGITPINYTLSSSSKIGSELIDLSDEMRRNGANPTLIIITPNVEAAFFDNSQLQSWANKNLFNLMDTNVKTFKTARQTFSIDGVTADIFTYVGGYTDSDGNFQYYIPFDKTGNTGKIILIDESFFRLAYGAIVNYKVEPSGRPLRGEAVVWEDITNNGSTKAIFMQTRPLPYVASSSAVKILNVTIS